MSFFETVMAQPSPIPYWVLWLTAVTTLAWIVFLFRRANWPDAAVVFVASTLNTVAMQWLFETRGFGPVLSLPHLVFWLPLFIYVAVRLLRGGFSGIQFLTAWLLVLSLCVSLLFDLRDAWIWMTAA